MSARLVQSCVVTLEPVAQAVAEAVDWQVVAPAEPPRGGASDDEAGDDDAATLVADDPDGPDPVEAQGGLLDLGEALAQQLSLALDPYPRAPGAALDPAEVGGHAADEPRPNPFAAALSRLRRPE